MFGKVVFQGQGGLTLGGLSRRLREVRAVAPTVVLVDIGTNDLSNGCDPGKLADGTVAFARELLTIPSVAQVVVYEILMRNPVQFSRFPVRPDFDHARQIANNKVRALIADLENNFLPSYKIVGQEK